MIIRETTSSPELSEEVNLVFDTGEEETYHGHVSTSFSDSVYSDNVSKNPSVERTPRKIGTWKKGTPLITNYAY
jgi:hypothetical protein